MNGTIRPFSLLILLGTISLISACRRESDRSGANKELQHFEGTIDTRRHTNDPILSALYVRASRALEEGDATAAEALYREVISRYPNDPDGYDALASCLYFQHKFDEAKAEYLRGLELDPKSIDSLYGLGCVAHKQKRYSESLDYLEKALALNEKNADCHRVLGMVHDAVGNKPKALSHYERAVELDPEFAKEDYIRSRLDALKQ